MVVVVEGHVSLYRHHRAVGGSLVHLQEGKLSERRLDVEERRATWNEDPTSGTPGLSFWYCKRKIDSIGILLYGTLGI